MRWDPNRVESQKLAVHAALLHTGKIVYFSGDEHDPGRHFLGKASSTYVDSTRVYDCATGAVSVLPSPQVPIGAATPDLFCCGHAFLSDGQLLVAGGTESWTRGHPGDPDPGGHHTHGHFTGLRYTWIFDPEVAPGTNPWKRAADMLPERGRTVGGGRWYPTLVTLAGGQCIALSGHPSTTHIGEHNNRMVETFEPAPAPFGHWEDRGDLPPGLDINLYPRLHLFRNYQGYGEVFCVTPMGNRCYAWQQATSTWRDVAAAPADTEYHGFRTTSILLPLLPHQNYEPRILLCGSAEPRVLNPLSPTPGWEPTSGPRQPIRGSASRKRIHLNAVILPTMDVMVCGGFDDAGPVREVEIYRPASDSWTTLPAAGTATVDRNYHSVALLMPDGRVWTAGGNDRGDWSYHNSAQYENQTPPRPLPTTAQDPGVDNRETQIELFEPPYYTRPDRPRITSAPSFASYGSTFTIRTPDAAVISRVALIRAGSVTHAFNGDQRYVGLRFTSGTDELYATAPPDGNVAPPGQYLLFIVSLIGEEAVPSVGTFVRVDWRPKVLKELKAELKELEVPVKRMPDIPDLKLTREVFDPNLPFIIDPNPLIRLLAERVDDLEDRLAQGQAFIRPEERPEVGDELLAEDAEASLAAREAAEAAARVLLPEEGEPYRPSPAEEQERRIGTEGEHAPELGSPEHGGHAHADVPPGPGGLPEAGDEEADQQIPE